MRTRRTIPFTPFRASLSLGLNISARLSYRLDLGMFYALIMRPATISTTTITATTCVAAAGARMM